jgi:hypothetical protein
VWGPASGITGSKMSAIEWRGRRDAYLLCVHCFVAHAKIMSAHEIGGQGWVDELRVDRGTCNPGLKLLTHGISRWRPGGRRGGHNGARHTGALHVPRTSREAASGATRQQSRLVRLGGAGGDGPV